MNQPPSRAWEKKGCSFSLSSISCIPTPRYLVLPVAHAHFASPSSPSFFFPALFCALSTSSDTAWEPPKFSRASPSVVDKQLRVILGLLSWCPADSIVPCLVQVPRLLRLLDSNDCASRSSYSVVPRLLSNAPRDVQGNAAAKGTGGSRSQNTWGLAHVHLFNLTRSRPRHRSRQVDGIISWFCSTDPRGSMVVW